MMRKCVGILIGLSHAKHVIPKAQLSGIVQALVVPIVRYCISVYGSCGDVLYRCTESKRLSTSVPASQLAVDNMTMTLIALSAT